MKHKIKITYETWDDEAVEIGETNDKGWIDQEGVAIEPCPIMETSLTDEAVDFLKSEGVCEASASCSGKGTWYTNPKHDEDYRTGEITQQSYHLYGFTDNEEVEIYDRLTNENII